MQARQESTGGNSRLRAAASRTTPAAQQHENLREQTAMEVTPYENCALWRAFQGTFQKVWVYSPDQDLLFGMHPASMFLLVAFTGLASIGLSSVSYFYTGTIVGLVMIAIALFHQYLSRVGVCLHKWTQAALWVFATMVSVVCLLLIAVRLQVLIMNPSPPLHGAFPSTCAIFGGCARLTQDPSKWDEELVRSAASSPLQKSKEVWELEGHESGLNAVRSLLPCGESPEPSLLRSRSRSRRRLALFGAAGSTQLQTQQGRRAQSTTDEGNNQDEDQDQDLQTVSGPATVSIAQTLGLGLSNDGNGTSSVRQSAYQGIYEFIALHSSPASVWPPSLSSWWSMNALLGGTWKRGQACLDSGNDRVFDPLADNWRRRLSRGMPDRGPAGMRGGVSNDLTMGSVVRGAASVATPNPVWLSQRGGAAFHFPGAAWQVREVLRRWVHETYQARVVEERAGFMQIEVLTVTLGFPDDIYVRWGCSLGRSVIEFHSEQRIGTSDFGVNAGRLRRIILALVDEASRDRTPSAPCL